MAGLAGAASLLTGCGFKLRGAYKTPFKTIYLEMTPNTSFSSWLERRLRAETDLEIVRVKKDAQAILQLVDETRSESILTINDAGRVREKRLEMAIVFRVVAPDGYEYLPSTRLSTIRDLNDSEQNYLSRDTEKATLYRDMTFDLVEQMMSVLETIKPRRVE